MLSVKCRISLLLMICLWADSIGIARYNLCVHSSENLTGYSISSVKVGGRDKVHIMYMLCKPELTQC